MKIMKNDFKPKNKDTEFKIKQKYINLNKKFASKKLKDPNKQKEYLSDKPKLNSLGYSLVSLRYVILIIWSAIVLVPIIFLIMQTFNGEVTKATSRIPWNVSFSFSTAAFDSLKDTSYWTWMVNSLIVSLSVAVIVILSTGFIGYAYSRYNFVGKKNSLIFITLINLIPTIAALVVFYILSEIIFNYFGMNRLFILVVIYSGTGIVSNLFLIKSGFDNLSREIDDSARMDGLGSWGLYTRMLLPLVKPILSIIAFWSFMGPFGDIIISQLILVDREQFTLGIGLRSLIAGEGQSINIPGFMAGGLIIAVPSILLFLLVQKNLVAGLASGAVKG